MTTRVFVQDPCTVRGRIRRRFATALVALGLLGIIAPVFTPAITVADGKPLGPIVVIVMENKTFKSITSLNKLITPYINCGTGFTTTGLICSGMEFTNYFSITAAASLPNYLAMTSGGTNGCLTNGCAPNSFTADNIFHQLRANSISVGSFQELMPRPCDEDPSGGPNKLYVRRHNPEIYYTDNQTSGAESTPCGTDNVAYSSLDTAALPAFSFITPDLCHDMHGSGLAGPCPTGTDQLIADGDAWLSQNVPPLLDAGARVIVTWDEGTAADAHVLAVEIGPGITPGTIDATPYDHYSLLAGLEDHFGVAELQNAGSATPLPIPVDAGPTIGSLSPSALGQGATNQTLTLSGTGFSSGAALASTIGGHAGVTVTSTTFVDATHLSLQVSVSSNALVASDYSVNLTNGDGGTATKANAFTVDAAPTISKVSPSSLPQGVSNQTLTFTGTGFSTGATAQISGTGVTVVSTTLKSSTRVSAVVTVSSVAETGPRKVRITNPDGGAGTCTGCFAISAA